MIGGPKRASVDTTTFTRTQHIVDVDLRGVLAGFDPTDEVILNISTPSGRAKAVRVPAAFLVEPPDPMRMSASRFD